MTSRTIHYDSIFSNNSIFNNVIHNISSIKQIQLASMELPITFFNVRDGLNTLHFVYNNIQYDLTIQPNQYNSITDLITELNSKLITVLNNTSINLKFDQNPLFIGKLIISTTIKTNSFSFSFNSILANSILGINTSDLCINGILLCSNNYNLNIDNYINMVINELPMRYNTNNMVKCTFRIPLSNSYNQVMFYGGYIQQDYICNPVKDLSTLEVIFYDRFGIPLVFSSNYSFSLLYIY